MVGNRFIRRMMRSMRNSSHAFTVSDKNLLNSKNVYTLSTFSPDQPKTQHQTPGSQTIATPANTISETISSFKKNHCRERAYIT